MEWSKEAERSLGRVPFFVRKKVRGRVEEEAVRCGAQRVEPHHLEAARKRFLNRMEEEVKGYQVEACFGQSGCENRAVAAEGLLREIERRVAKRDLKGFLKKSVEGPLKLHHEFRISVSDCPNACSRPQIVDVGLIGACSPEICEKPCDRCGACVKVCKERAIFLGPQPRVDRTRCVACAGCIKVCPTGTLREGEKGFRVLLGGRLGRHPRLAEELPGIHSREKALAILEQCLTHYLKHSRKGERFGAVWERTKKNFPVDLSQGAEERNGR